ncbi:MAG TPA: hypothetical protein V6C71_06315 [Coleofasciculaceae cyanobacterium]|jgi:phosphoenolpyruvate synthase/pyruvate phosphate dikinase
MIVTADSDRKILQDKEQAFVLWFEDVGMSDVALLGGKNASLGDRLAGYKSLYDPKYRAAFALECQAFKQVRDNMGLTNVVPMIPFCRTPTSRNG